MDAGEGGNRHDEGMRVRREVLGDVHVDAAGAASTPIDQDFQRLVTETAWGSVWARPGLDRRTRSLITISILAALGRREELPMHLRAARRTGASMDEVAEALLHVAVYAGIPAAHSAFAAAKEVAAEPAEEGPSA